MRKFKVIFLLMLCVILVLTGCKGNKTTEAGKNNDSVNNEQTDDDNSSDKDEDAGSDKDEDGEKPTKDGDSETSTKEEEEATTKGDSDNEYVEDVTKEDDTEAATKEGNGKEDTTTSGNDSNQQQKPTTDNNSGSGNAVVDTPDPGIPSGSVLNIDTDRLPYTEEQIYSQLFDINNKIEIDVDITDETLALIQQDYEEYSSWGSKSPIYRKADLNITITTATDTYTYHIDDIGIRMKGNTSRTAFYSEEDGVYNLIHFKVDFQETFDDENYYSSDATNWGTNTAARDARKNRTFATLEKLEFKWNRNDDTTYIREYYTYEFYRASGVLAPHTNLASFNLGDLHQGVFMMYEPVDKIFIEKYVAEEDQGGDLYKCGWTFSGAGFFSNSSMGVENEDNGEFYNYDLKTNKKKSEHEALKNLLSVMNNSKVTKAQIAEVIDIDNFLKFEAVSYFVGNPDDVRNNYNNYYIYFNASTNKMIFIPYDLDRCFGVTCGWNPTGDGMTSVSPFSKYAAGANQNQANPIYVKTVDEGGYYVAEFAEVLATVAKSEWLTTEKFNSIYNIAYNNYKNDTKPSKTFNNAGGHDFTFNNTSDGHNMTFKSYITAKMATYNNYAGKVDEYAASVQPYYIRGSFTNWGINENYKMTYNKASNTYTYNLTLTSSSPWKVNNGIDGGAGDWFGGEEVTEIASGINVTTDQDDNIILPAGTYKITFYADTWLIKIE